VLLALDTSSPQVAVALADGDDVAVELTSEQAMKHGEQLAPLIARALDRAGLVRQDLTAVAVGVGPGPFTGLRVGLVTARTLGFVLEIPVYGVCSLDVLASEAVGTGAVSTPFLVATDARRKEVYWATYDEAGARLTAPSVDRPLDVETEHPVVGEGAVLYPMAFPAQVGPRRPSAAWLARTVAGELAPLVDPEPMYLRRPDAVAPGPPKAVS
jgi:tRNA threonylcarbamoyl adenosine modification protein YeaZ